MPGGFGSVVTRTVVSARGAVSLVFSVLALICSLLSGCSSSLRRPLRWRGSGGGRGNRLSGNGRGHRQDPPLQTKSELCHLRDWENDIGGGCG